MYHFSAGYIIWCEHWFGIESKSDWGQRQKQNMSSWPSDKLSFIHVFFFKNSEDTSIVLKLGCLTTELEWLKQHILIVFHFHTEKASWILWWGYSEPAITMQYMELLFNKAPISISDGNPFDKYRCSLRFEGILHIIIGFKHHLEEHKRNVSIFY